MPCARNKVFNRLEALHGKPSLSIAFNTISKTKKYICALTFNQATWFTYRERWFKWVTAIRITLIIFEFANLWLNALNEGQVYPWVHRWRLIVLVHIFTTLSPSAAKLLLPVQQNCYSDNFLDQLRAFPPPFGQSPSGLPLLRTFVWCLMEKLTRNNEPFLDTFQLSSRRLRKVSMSFLKKHSLLFMDGIKFSFLELTPQWIPRNIIHKMSYWPFFGNRNIIKNYLSVLFFKDHWWQTTRTYCIPIQWWLISLLEQSTKRYILIQSFYKTKLSCKC